VFQITADLLRQVERGKYGQAAPADDRRVEGHAVIECPLLGVEEIEACLLVVRRWRRVRRLARKGRINGAAEL
jgi:hypothetical protein